MRKIITLLCSISIIISAMFFATSVFCTNIVSQSMVDAVIEQIHIKEQLNHIFTSIGLPENSMITKEIDTMINDVLHDEEVVKELNKYTEAVIFDLANNDYSEITSNLNESIKEEVVSYADDISALTNHFISEKTIAEFLSSNVDMIDFQSLYKIVIEEVKASFTPAETQALKVVGFLQTKTAYYGSLIILLFSSLAIIIVNLSKKHCFRILSYLWGFCGVLLLVGSIIAKPLLNHFIHNDMISKAISDNIGEVFQLSIMYLIVATASLLLYLIHKRLVRH